MMTIAQPLIFTFCHTFNCLLATIGNSPHADYQDDCTIQGCT